MSKIIWVVLLCAVTVQALSTAFVVAGYELNKDYIAKHLCENRDKPKMHCNGCCHLKKELARDEKQNQNNGNEKKYGSNILFSAHHAQAAFGLTTVATLYYHPHSNGGAAFAATVFHPPGSLS